jgi:hypothetical protein
MRLYNKGMLLFGRPMAKPLFFAFSVFALGLVSFTQSAESARTGLDLPQPNGCYPVGVKTLSLTDTSRSWDTACRPCKAVARTGTQIATQHCGGK